MPSPAEHSEQAKSNEELAKNLRDGPSHYDWAITVTFYAALHYLEAYLVKQHVNVLEEAEKAKMGVHNCRNLLVQEMLERTQAGRYLSLHQQSERARYFSSKTAMAVQGIPAQYFDQQMAQRWYAELEQFRNHLTTLR